ncbi:GIY-YIG nuclease family protein [Roseivirga echinicomitans]|uniref:Endonuclease n=1 Tax=Roseivirga echinicomitans TaxID=296218 RepID=A0A150X151_9BACT|nr:GIY-YIG nuclease family protein [Roseivirga echinicomitans]KYG72448.1 endonuclease [Roseivirga echinicomitans]
MHYVYILYSPSTDRYYIGETAFVSGRLEQHNSGFYKNSVTKIASDWEMFLEIECIDRTQALRLERFIKQQKSRKFIERLKSEPKIVDDLLLRFK